MMVDAIDDAIENMRHLDDVAGGGHQQHLDFVHTHINLIASYLQSGAVNSEDEARRLVKCWGQLAQLAGWMSEDAAQHGLAQRYYLTALRGARGTKDRNLAAFVISYMIRQAVHRGQARDAVELANAGMEILDGTQYTMRALITSRYAMAQAAAGNLYGFRTAMEQAHQLLGKAEAAIEQPEYVYWLDEAKLSGHTGIGLTMLGKSSTRNTASLLAEAEGSLAAETGRDATDLPRDTVYYGAWRAQALMYRGELEEALTTARICLSRHPHVKSPLSLTMLQKLNVEIMMHPSARKMPALKEFQDELRMALAS